MSRSKWTAKIRRTLVLPRWRHRLTIKVHHYTEVFEPCQTCVRQIEPILVLVRQEISLNSKPTQLSTAHSRAAVIVSLSRYFGCSNMSARCLQSDETPTVCILKIFIWLIIPKSPPGSLVCQTNPLVLIFQNMRSGQISVSGVAHDLVKITDSTLIATPAQSIYPLLVVIFAKQGH